MVFSKASAALVGSAIIATSGKYKNGALRCVFWIKIVWQNVLFGKGAVNGFWVLSFYLGTFTSTNLLRFKVFYLSGKFF